MSRRNGLLSAEPNDLEVTFSIVGGKDAANFKIVAKDTKTATLKFSKSTARGKVSRHYSGTGNKGRPKFDEALQHRYRGMSRRLIREETDYVEIGRRKADDAKRFFDAARTLALTCLSYPVEM